MFNSFTCHSLTLQHCLNQPPPFRPLIKKSAESFFLNLYTIFNSFYNHIWTTNQNVQYLILYKYHWYKYILNLPELVWPYALQVTPKSKFSNKTKIYIFIMDWTSRQKIYCKWTACLQMTPTNGSLGDVLFFPIRCHFTYHSIFDNYFRIKPC